MNLLKEEINRIKSMMGIITESNISLPIKFGTTWSAIDPKKPNKKDADLLHSFERRNSDKQGALIGTQIEEKLKELYDAGINPDVNNLELIVDSKNYTVTWRATIDESKDGKAYMGIATRGSAGGGSDTRAAGQVEPLKQDLRKKGAEDITLFLDFKNTNGVPIRQYFFKYTLPDKYPPHESGTSNYTRTEDPVVSDNSDDDEVDVEDGVTTTTTTKNPLDFFKFLGGIFKK